MTTTSGTATVTLLGDTQILITRDFDAPTPAVWRAWTEPELVKRWWAGRRGTVDSVEIDLRVGGRWRYVMTAHGGFEVAFHGDYQEIVPGQRLVNTEVYEGMPDAPALSTVTFTAAGDRTRVEILIEHERPEHRDGHIGSGMEAGMQESMDALEQVAREL